jgi:1,2-diacylglycerol 3-beta-galactosyltransferase
MNEPKKRILILTADAGFGHRSAAKAVAAALQEKYGDRCEVEIVNPLDDRRAPFLLRDSQADYDRLVRSVPELYRFGYDASDTTVTTAIIESALILLLFEVMLDLVRSFHPDAFLITYPLYQPPLEAVFTLRGEDIPMLTVVTDLANVHRVWFSRAVDACLVPTSIVASQALSYGLSTEQVQVTGIPINPEAYQDPRSRAELRRDLGWQEDLLTILAVGSRRVDRLLDTLNVFNHFGRPLQLAVVAGNDHDLYEELRKIEWHVPAHLYEFVPNVPLFMRAADCVVCKAGGLIVTESLAAGSPLMLIDIIPGQETGNGEYVISGGAGDLARSDMEVLETMSHWLMDGEALLKERARAAAELGRPMAAYTVADQLFQAAVRGAQPHRHLLTRRTLIDLLNRNEIKWGDTKELRETRNGPPG